VVSTATVGLAFGAFALSGTANGASETAGSVDAGRHAKPTIVLEHGAFADGSSWNGVIADLRADGYPVVAAANPLRGPAADAAALRTVLDHVKGPKILVGHSYGGNVISQAATNDPEVKALVYVAAFLPAPARAPWSSPTSTRAPPSPTPSTPSPTTRPTAPAPPTCTSGRTSSIASSPPTCPPGRPP
jgi:pimeloyl-ACP methyl ester carboxylesterase